MEEASGAEEASASAAEEEEEQEEYEYEYGGEMEEEEVEEEKSKYPVHDGAEKGLKDVMIIPPSAREWVITDDEGCTPLHVAIIARQIAVLQHIVGGGGGGSSDKMKTEGNKYNTNEEEEEEDGHGGESKKKKEEEAVLWRKCNGSPLLHLIVSVASLRENEEFGEAAMRCVLERCDKLLFSGNTDEYGRTIMHLCSYYHLPKIAKIVFERLDIIRKETPSMKMKFIKSAEELFEEKNEGEGVAPKRKWEELETAEKEEFVAKSIALRTAFGARIGNPAPIVDAREKLNEATPLHVGCEQGCAEMVKLLCEAGARLNVRDGNGRTPLELAEKREHKECVEILKSFLVAKKITNGEEDGTTSISTNSTNSTSSTSSGDDNKRKRRGRTAILTHKICSQHYSCSPHSSSTRGCERPPENVNRLRVLIEPGIGTLRSSKLEEYIEWKTAPKGKMSDVLKIHEWSYIKKIEKMCESLIDEDSLMQLDGDTTISRETYKASLFAAGSVCEGVDCVMKGENENVFCAIRPPGHHAGPNGVVTCKNDSRGSYGFCIFNNVAIGAAYARDVYRNLGIVKIAIVDFDVHHGNGTEACVKNVIPSMNTITMEMGGSKVTMNTPSYKPWLDTDDADNIMFISAHGYGKSIPGLNPDPSAPPFVGSFYPSSGENFGFDGYPSSSQGEPVIIDFGQNSKSRKEWKETWENDILPKLASFKPDMMFISAGFDAHTKDTINGGYIGLIEDDYKWITEELMKIANTCCQGRIISVLEGGYAIQGCQVSAFARSVLTHVETLAKGVHPWETYSPPPELSSFASVPMEETTENEPPISTEEEIVSSSGISKRSRRNIAHVDYAFLNQKLEEETQAKKKQKLEEQAKQESTSSSE